MEKSCENCLHFGNPRCTTCNDLGKYKPDYPTLEQKNRELKQQIDCQNTINLALVAIVEKDNKTIKELTKSLEWACEWIMQYADETGDCYACPKYTVCNRGLVSDECKQDLIQHFKEGLE
jgi:hypothetical protein